MKYLSFILSAFIFCACNNITGSGNIRTENRNVGEFSGVQTSGSINVEVTGGNKLSVEVEADDNVLRHIVTEVDNGLLDIYYEPNTSFTNVHTKVYVTAPDIKKLFVNGSGNITSKNRIKGGGSLATKISGSGNINADVDATEVEADISGSGNLTLQGRCKNFDGSISGSGNLKCKNLLSENATVKIIGSGTAHVYSSISLKASTIGSGDIYYSGKPGSTQIDKTGSGDIRAEN